MPSRNAICRPSVSFKKRFIAVSTTVMESLSGSMKSSALAMEMNTSSLMRSGMPYLRMKSSTRELVLRVDEVLALDEHRDQRRRGLELLREREHLLVEQDGQAEVEAARGCPA